MTNSGPNEKQVNETEPAIDEQPAPDPDSTVGTGSIFAIGCSIITILVILVGVAIFIAGRLD